MLDASTPQPDAGLPAEALPGLGARLRELRRSAGLGLESAAARVGLSPAHLSRLETGRRQPSLPVLLGLSRAYGKPVSALLGEGEPADEPVIRAAAAAADVTGRAGGWIYRAAGLPGRAMQPLRVHIPPEVQDHVVRVHPGEEWLYVLDGRLRLALDDEEYRLDPGDSAHFDSMRPHRLAAATSAGTDLLFVHTLLQSSTADLCIGGHR
ncbi:helix-turn-helix domain-containing protein [Phaeacidiphilus oryzae]|jgi:transcriptional regulator with XRE-family HTH domain|uniref:helix-turn-helix domain-containing protein n=1 Tax=Phaeacidiphilus oryzae TaxID=348818 RepID=UPI00055EDB2E|nr:XRE family transcriptional regulator [Phaeacidiphilus oryzae]